MTLADIQFRPDGAFWGNTDIPVTYTEEISVTALPERTWEAGQSGPLPEVPDSCYGADAVPLDEEMLPPDWTTTARSGTAYDPGTDLANPDPDWKPTQEQIDNGSTQASGGYFPTIDELVAEDPDGYVFAIERAIWDDENGFEGDHWEVVLIYRAKDPAVEHFTLLDQQSQIAAKLRQLDAVFNYRVQAYKIQDAL